MDRMRILILAILTLTVWTFNLIGQTSNELTEIADDIVFKARKIYDLERASWIAGDSLSKNKSIDKSKLESYISYAEGDNVICIFYTPNDYVVSEYKFHTSSSVPVSTVETRKCTDNELKLIEIKRAVKNKIKNGELKKVKLPRGTTFNFVPVIWNGQKICYLINAINDNSKTILGRDYIIDLLRKS